MYWPKRSETGRHTRALDRQTDRQTAKRFDLEYVTFCECLAGDTEEGEEPQGAKGLRVHEPRGDPRQDCRDAGKKFTQNFAKKRTGVLICV
jgi:hypothetical protein